MTSESSPGPVNHRKERCVERPSRGPHNSLWYWSKDKSALRVAYNWTLMALGRISPSFRLKRLLYRAMGARVARHASVGLEVTLDVIFPELITIEEDVIVGYGSTVLCHEYTRDFYRTGPVLIRKDATIGANCTILPGVVIGEGAQVSAMSLVNRDVPPGELWGGIPAAPLRRKPARDETPEVRT